MKFQIAEKRWVGEGEPVFIIAEVGNNHQGRIELAKNAIRAAADAGADAVSFQYAPLHSYCTRDMYDHPNLAFLKECEFTPGQLKELAGDVHACGMAFSINVEDANTLDVVLDIGIDFIKLCSADLTNLPYIQYCASKSMPIFFSTGAAWLGEIERAYYAMKNAGLNEFVIYHTNSGYPTPIEDANIRQMDLLHTVFNGVKGYCDHTVDIIPPVVAVARGAKVIEKHITTDRSLKGDDWMVSLEPGEFKTMVRYIREAEASLGNAEKKPLPVEEGTRTFKRKSIVTGRAIRRGELFEAGDFVYKLPGTGLAPYELSLVVGKRAATDIGADVTLTADMVEY